MDMGIGIPVSYGLPKGICIIKEVVKLEDVLHEVNWVNVSECDIPKRSPDTYLVLVENKTIMLSSISCFDGEDLFSVSMGVEISKGDIRAFHTALDTK